MDIGQDFEIIEHTADAGIRAYGRDLKEAFANAARGMFSLIVEADSVEERSKIEVQVTAADRESLLVEFLNELIYHFDVDFFLVKRCQIHQLTSTEIEASCFGESVNKARHQLKTSIKSVTFHGLKITLDQGFQVQVYLDL